MPTEAQMKVKDAVRLFNAESAELGYTANAFGSAALVGPTAIGAIVGIVSFLSGNVGVAALSIVSGVIASTVAALSVHVIASTFKKIGNTLSPTRRKAMHEIRNAVDNGTCSLERGEGKVYHLLFPKSERKERIFLDDMLIYASGQNRAFKKIAAKSAAMNRLAA